MIRVAVFAEWPEALLLKADSGPVIIPQLECPFTKTGVAEAFSGREFVRIVDARPGRWIQNRLGELRRSEQQGEFVSFKTAAKQILAPEVYDELCDLAAQITQGDVG